MPLSLSELGGYLFRLVTTHAYWAVFITLAIEGTGMPGPILVVFAAAGYLVSQGRMSLPLVILIATLGNVVGNAVGYMFGFAGGGAFVRRYGRFFSLNEDGIQMAHGWFQKYGSITAFLARIIGFIRTPTIFASGLARMSLPKFLFFSGLGDLVWSTFWAYVGFFIGLNWKRAVGYLGPYGYSLIVGWSVLGVIISMGMLSYMGRRRMLKKRE